jgi:CubicO group peptidase (beta-lactamase class C family)
MTEVQGTCDARFKEVRDTFAANLASGGELGASLVVDIDGEVLVDIWGGHRDEGGTEEWQSDTIVNVWSTTKTVTALSALVLASRGQLDFDAPVAQYWPEFAAAGKEGVLVRHLMSHTSGVAALDAPAVMDDLYDWERSTSRLAAQAPWWEPGTASGYHALVYGHLIGEVIRRITGKGLKQFVADELAGPLGADFQIGARPGDAGRIAPVVPPPPLALDMGAVAPDSIAVKTFTGPMIDAAAANTDGWRAADIGGANGHGNARSVARLLSAVALGGKVDGTELVAPSVIERIFDVQADGVDLVLGVPIRFGIGFGLPEPQTIPYIPDGRLCFWGGWGGSVIFMDLERRLTFSYMMNKMADGIIGSARAESYVRPLYSALDVSLPG